MERIKTSLSSIYQERGRLLTLIFCLSVICSIAFLIFFKNIGPEGHRIPGTDYFVRYEPIAKNIISGKGITFEGAVHPEFAPGYPIILAGIFALSQKTGINELDLVVFLNIIFSAATCCFLFLITKEIFNTKIGLVASLAWMTYPFNLWFLKNPHTEVPFLTFLYAGLYAYVLALKKKDIRIFFFSGLILGLSCLIRFPTIFLPIFLALIALFLLENCSKGMRLALAAFLLLGNLVAMAPWAAYAFSSSGRFIPVSSQAKESLSAGFIVLLGIESGDNSKSVVSPQAKEEIKKLKETASLGSSKKTLEFLSEELKSQPKVFFELIWLRLVRVWYGTTGLWWESQILAVQLLYLLTAVAGLSYGIKKNKENIRGVILLLAVISYFWAISFASVSILRYMIPAMGAVIVFSAIAITPAIERIINNINK